MEQWEALIEGYPSSPDLRHFGKALQTAGVVLKEDLAPFEIEWITETLLFKPVEVLSIISSNRNDSVWSKHIENAFKLLTDMVTNHPESLESHYEDIVKLCHLSYDAQTRKQALHWLIAVARRSAAGASFAERLVASLEELQTCKAPMALLVGTICEYHPETVADQFTKIWRIYLNLLDSNKNTDTITSAVLQGLLCLFKHFGCDLPTGELGDFYDRMTRDFLTMTKCEDVCLSILEHHSNLFRERISSDARLRMHLWRTLQDARNRARALRSIYTEISKVLDKNKLQTIINTELLPQTQSSLTQVKYTALRVLTQVRSEHNLSVSDNERIDVQTLQFELRGENVSYDTAEAISWCIESNLPNSDQLLQSAILFYTNLPASKRKEIVVHGILNAPSELRTASISFLITETCQDNTTIDKYLPLWQDLFNTENGQDIVVLDKARLVFEDVLTYVSFVLETFLEDKIVEKIPDKLTTLLTLSTHVLSLQPPEQFTTDHCTALLPLLLEVAHLYGSSASLMGVVRWTVTHGAEVGGHVGKIIHIDRCRDEALLCESCLTLIDAPNLGNPEQMLMALQIIFSRNDVEPKVLSKALQKFETLMVGCGQDLCKNTIAEIIRLVEKLRTRKEITGKDARILHRDVLMFLGKYGDKIDGNNNMNTAETTLIVRLGDLLALNVPDPHEGTMYKINLQSILQLAIMHEEPNALQTLLVIICANLSTRSEPTLQVSLTHVVRALTRAHARGAAVDPRAVHGAALSCGTVPCVQVILTYISEEQSPGARKMLSDALEALLTKDPGSDLTDTLVNTVAEYAVVMMSSEHSTTKRAGLDISETLITALKANNALTKKLLPTIILSIAKTNEIDSEKAFNMASDALGERIQLFDNLESLVEDLLILLMKNRDTKMMEETMKKAFKNISKASLVLIKKVYNNEDDGMVIQKLLSVILDIKDITGSRLYVIAELRSVFDFEEELCRRVLLQMDFPQLILYEDFFQLKFGSDEMFCMEAVLRFLEEYSTTLMELDYEQTRKVVANTVATLTPKCIKHLHRNITSFLSIYIKKFHSIPKIILNSFQNWCNQLPLKGITHCIEEDVFTSEHALIVHSLKIMLNTFNLTDLSVLTDAQYVQKWPRILMKLFSTDYISDHLKSKMAFLTDLLTVSVRFSKVTDVKRLILEGHSVQGVSNKIVGLQFCRFFMNVFFDVLIKKPFILMDEDMEECCILLNDVVKYALKKKCADVQYEYILELVDQLWQIYEIQPDSTFDQKHSLLLDLTNIPKKLGPDSKPMQWACNQICSECSREEKARLIGVLPGGEEYKATYQSFARTLPTRMSEAHASLRALLDALATTSDLQLLEIVMTLAGGDDTIGWWDDAMECCMASIALQGNMGVCKAVFKRCWEGLSLGVCNRVMVPLLRYSTSQFNERFFSTTMTDILSTLKKEQRVATAQYVYHKCLVDYTRALSVLQVAFEKVPPSSLESPNSVLYSETPTQQQSWFLVRQTCKLCVTLRDKVTLPDDTLRSSYRQFQCAIYKCLTAAICRRRPDAAIYEKCVFNVHAWAKLVDCDVTYRLPLRSQWNQRTKRQPTSIEVSSSTLSSQPSSTRTLTRTRLFLRTLSENVLQYDLIDDGATDTAVTQDLQLNENELNSHECAATLTAVTCHVTALSHTGWRDAIVCVLTGDAHRNVKLFVAQAICNCKEELKPHAAALRPALLAFISGTVDVENERRVLNGLHVDVLDTLIHWSDESPQPSPHLDKTIECLITTCLENRQRQAVYRALLDGLSRLVDLYGAVVNVAWSVFQPYLQETSPDINKTIQILQRITKAKIHIPELLPALTAKLESKHTWQLSKLSELYGLALSADRNVSGGLLARFRKVLDQLRRGNSADYVKMLYYAQMGHPQCCDESHFRTITDKVPKIVGVEKGKCLNILSSYISTHPHNEYIPDMLETIDICELIGGDSCVEALGLVAGGLGLMKDGLRRRVVMQVAGYCRHSLVKVRKAACSVMLKAFEDLFITNETGPLAKKPKTNPTTPITAAVDSKDIYRSTVLTSLGLGVTDRVDEIAAMARRGVADRLATDMAVRFTDCFIIAVYLPSTSTSNKTLDLSACVSAVLEMLFSNLRSQERFKRIRLRDEPLAMRESTSGPSKLLTMSRTYQGTFRRPALTGKRNNIQTRDSSVPDIDVQVPIDNILEILLQFAKETPEASQALCVQILKSLLRGSPSFDSKAIASQLGAILSRQATELTVLVLDLCRVFVDDTCKLPGFQATVENLKSVTEGTEGELHTKLLYEDVRLRSAACDLFVLGSMCEGGDVKMEQELPFTVEDLTAVFGKLSNWDNLTTQQKRRIQNSGLPPLWTDKQTIVNCLKDYRGEGWFSKMVSAYHHEDRQDAMKWLREVDTWPRRAFHISAVSEAVEWFQKDEESLNKFSCDIQPSDCLAEWAARLMIRAAYLNSLETDCESSPARLSRSHELQWCERANETTLAYLVLDCVKRNTLDMYESETLPWLRQKVLALRTVGLQRNDGEVLKDALSTAERYTPLFAAHADARTNIGMQRLILQLNGDLQSLSKEKLHDILKEVDQQMETGDGVTQTDKHTLSSIYELAITYYDDLWGDSEAPVQDNLLSDMTHVLGRTIDLNLSRRDAFLALILNRLDQFVGQVLSDTTAKKLLDKINHLSPTLDDFSLQQVKSHRHLFPSHSLNEYSFMSERESDSVDKYKRCFQLVCDAEYLLLQYCDLLRRALGDNDSIQWEEVFDRMKQKIFENPYEGSAYQLLTKYKNRLYGVCDYEYSGAYKTKAQQILKDTIRELRTRKLQSVLRLSELCPELAQRDSIERDTNRDACLAKLLGLPANVTVIRFDEQVPVFTDSVRRPTVTRALLSSGESRRYLHKSGEPLRVDAAAQRVLAAASHVWGGGSGHIVGYNVTPLSEDCGLIEFLEDHERVRSLISVAHDLDVVLDTVPRPADHELILAPMQASVQQHHQLCDKVPPYALRSAIERNSASVHDFIVKKQRFLETLAPMTILNWILGLGDRHLQNILYSIQDGGVCSVDWNAVFQFGSGELPPARLTRNILAVCDIEVLESLLQRLLAGLRDSHKLFLAIIKISFKWMGTDFHDKYPYIETALQGKARSFDITRAAIDNSSIKYKEKYIQLLDSVFQQWPAKERYSVEEQVASLLRQCTDPQILSVTRSGWEPWI